MTRRVTIVTAGHLATSPRMLKAADALDEAGYAVRVVSANFMSWAADADRRVRARRRWRSTVVDYQRDTAAARWFITGARFRAAQVAASRLGARRPKGLAVAAFSRIHCELVSAILSEDADLVYGGKTGAIAAVAEAARRMGRPFAVDFEDFHCGEQRDDPAGRIVNELADIIMRDVARDAAFITAGSAAIADACAARFGVRPIAVHNTFELPTEAPRWNGHAAGPLRMYWFSQTIGPPRGLEDVVAAAGLIGRPCELHVRGVPAAGYIESLQVLVTSLAPKLTLIRHEPIDPDVLVDTCRGFDVGLAPEQMAVPNQELALSNKSLTYPLAGVPVVITETPGQRALARDLGAGAVCYRPGDVASLAGGLARWFDDPDVLRAAGAASWEAARRRWHWRHPEECGALVAAVARVVS